MTRFSLALILLFIAPSAWGQTLVGEGVCCAGGKCWAARQENGGKICHMEDAPTGLAIIGGGGAPPVPFPKPSPDCPPGYEPALFASDALHDGFNAAWSCATRAPQTKTPPPG